LVSLKEPTEIVIVEGIMDANLFMDVLEASLLPFIWEKFARGQHKFMQVNYYGV